MKMQPLDLQQAQRDLEEQRLARQQLEGSCGYPFKLEQVDGIQAFPTQIAWALLIPTFKYQNHNYSLAIKGLTLVQASKLFFHRNSGRFRTQAFCKN